eukprot:g24818.t1
MSMEAMTVEEEFNAKSCPKFVTMGTQRNKAEAFAEYRAVSIGERKSLHQLSDISFYLPLDHDPTNDTSGHSINYVFSPLVQYLLMYIHDSSDILHQFQNFQFAGSRRLLFTTDMQSLYTSFPRQDTFRTLHFFLEQRPESSPPTTILLCLAELVLTLKNFSFNSSHFLQ